MMQNALIAAPEDAESVGSILLSLKRDSPVLAPLSAPDATSRNSEVTPASSSSTATTMVSTTAMPHVVSSISLDGVDNGITKKRPPPQTAQTSQASQEQVEQQPSHVTTTSAQIAIAASSRPLQPTHDGDGQPAHKKRKLAIMMKVLEARGVSKKFVIRPSDYVRSAFKSNGFPALAQTIESDLISRGAFRPPTKDMVAAYTAQVLDMARRNDLDGLKAAHSKGQSLNCCNAFGESLLHGACRRGQTSIVKFLVEEVQVDVLSVRDDYQRTVLHDAFWTAQPNFELVETILNKAPELLLLTDVRGFTPLDYVPTQDWAKWLRFLFERKTMLRPKVVVAAS